MARYRDAKPRTTITNEAIRIVCSRLCCRSTDPVNARLTTKTTVALATLRRIVGAGILREWPGHAPALFVNPDVLDLWTGE